MVSLVIYDTVIYIKNNLSAHSLHFLFVQVSRDVILLLIASRVTNVISFLNTVFTSKIEM